MIRQHLTQQPGPDGGWIVTTFYNGYRRRDTWTLGNRQDAEHVAYEDRIGVLERVADEVGG